MAKETVKINICGKERLVRFSAFALMQLKKETGIQLSDLQDPEKAEDLGTIIAIVWAGLIHESPELTIDDVAKDIDLTDMETIVTKVVSALPVKENQ